MTSKRWHLPTGRPGRGENRERLVVVTGKIPASLHLRLKAVMQRDGIDTESEAVRLALEEFVAQREGNAPEQESDCESPTD